MRPPIKLFVAPSCASWFISSNARPKLRRGPRVSSCTMNLRALTPRPFEGEQLDAIRAISTQRIMPLRAGMRAEF